MIEDPRLPKCTTARMTRRRTLTLVLGVGLLAALGAPRDAAAEAVLTPQETLERVEAGGLMLIDVRRPSEWAETGVPTPAQEATMHLDAGPRAFLASVDALVDGDRSQPVALICASGVRSSWASRFLEANGYSAVFSVAEGVLGRRPNAGWIARGLPMRACESC